jgi:hypothetical protein
MIVPETDFERDWLFKEYGRGESKNITSYIKNGLTPKETMGLMVVYTDVDD